MSKQTRYIRKPVLQSGFLHVSKPVELLLSFANGKFITGTFVRVCSRNAPRGCWTMRMTPTSPEIHFKAVVPWSEGWEISSIIDTEKLTKEAGLPHE